GETCSTPGTTAFRRLASGDDPGASRRADSHHGLLAPMSTRSQRSISLPIALSSVAVALSIALLVGWTLLIVRNPALAHDIIANRVLLGVGIGGFFVIMTVLVLFSVFLVREIREVRRQTSFIDSVTHELKSPLSALKLCLETLGREGLPA